MIQNSPLKLFFTSAVAPERKSSESITKPCMVQPGCMSLYFCINLNHNLLLEFVLGKVYTITCVVLLYFTSASYYHK